MLELAGVAAWLVVTAIVGYGAYLVGLTSSNKKWSESYSKLYRTALVEIMNAYAGKTAVGDKFVQPKQKPVTKNNKTDDNILSFPKKGDTDETRH